MFTVSMTEDKFQGMLKSYIKKKATEVDDHAIYCCVGNSSDIPVADPVRE